MPLGIFHTFNNEIKPHFNYWIYNFTVLLLLLGYNLLLSTERTPFESQQLELDQRDDPTEWISGTTWLRPLALSFVQVDANFSIPFAA